MPVNSVSTELPTQAENEEILPLNLPITQNLRLGYLSSTLIVILTATTAIAGMLYADTIYPTEELEQSFMANDVVTLFLGLPLLLLSMWLTHRGQLVGLLFWPGAIFYGLYNYTIYLFAIPLTIMYPVYLLIVTVSIYTTIGLVAAIDGKVVKQRIQNSVPLKIAAAPLIGFGCLFMLRTIGVMGNAISTQTNLSGTEFGLLVADFIACAGWIIGGILLWRRQPLGYVGGVGLLFSTSMLFVGVIAVLLLQPIISGGALLVIDIVVLLIMGLICFVPFLLYLRGVIKS